MTIDPTGWHATFPWFDATQEALADDGVGLDDLLADPDHSAVQRAIERIETAIDDGDVSEPALDPTIELYSYPVARVIVSALADEAETIVPAYAAAEARTFRTRATEQIDAERSDLAIADLRAEFGIDARRDEGATDGPWGVAVADYLAYTPDASLTGQPIADGRVPVMRSGLFGIFEAACRERVAANLPHDLPDAIATAVEPVAAALRGRLSRETAPIGFAVVTPTDFPPCLRAALRNAQIGEELRPAAAFALVAFLTACGMDAAAIATLAGGGLSESRVAVLQRHIATDDGDLLYEPPSCTAMMAADCCVNPDERCDRIDHPHRYYEATIDDRTADE